MQPQASIQESIYLSNQTLEHKSGLPRSAYGRWGKRLIDLVFVWPVLLTLSPVLAALALLIRLDSPGPILFVQYRVGRGGGLFREYKFRTMVDRNRPAEQQVFSDDPDITRVGRFLRRFKLDELPQLVNILNGDMSIVGPRPDLPIRLREYGSKDRQRLLVLPGLTGLAQIHGNIHLPFPERWQYDRLYVANLSFRLDAWIVLRTLRVILLGEEHSIRRLQHPHGESGDVLDTGVSSGAHRIPGGDRPRSGSPMAYAKLEERHVMEHWAP